MEEQCPAGIHVLQWHRHHILMRLILMLCFREGWLAPRDWHLASWGGEEGGSPCETRHHKRSVTQSSLIHMSMFRLDFIQDHKTQSSVADSDKWTRLAGNRDKMWNYSGNLGQIHYSYWLLVSLQRIISVAIWKKKSKWKLYIFSCNTEMLQDNWVKNYLNEKNNFSS